MAKSSLSLRILTLTAFACLTPALSGCPEDDMQGYPTVSTARAGSGGSFVPPTPLPPKVTLSGTYEAFYAPNGGANALGYVTRYAFSTSGLYDTCVTRVSPAGRHHEKDSGRYTVDGSSLRLESDDAGSQRVAFAYDSANQIRIGNVRFSRSTSAKLCD